MSKQKPGSRKGDSRVGAKIKNHGNKESDQN